MDSASGGTGHQGEGRMGATLPDDAGLSPCLGDPLGALQAAGIICPMLIELAPCFRLDCEHHLVGCFVPLIIEARPLPNRT